MTPFDSPPNPYRDDAAPPSPADGGSMSAMAIAALVCAIVGFCVPGLGLVGLILGIVALAKINDPTNRLRGYGMALAGAIIGGLSLLVIPLLLIAILLPALGAARRSANRIRNQANHRSVLQGLTNYAEYNLNQLPGSPRNSKDTDTTVPGRLFPLIAGGWIDGQMLHNPVDPVPMVLAPAGPAQLQTSYTLQRADTPAWANDINTVAVLTADEQLSGGGSHWNTSAWQGAVGWGDTHVTFEEDSIVTTNVQNTPVTNDELFDTRDNAQLVPGDQ